MRRSFLHKSFFVFLIFAVLAGLFSLGAGQIVSADEYGANVFGWGWSDNIGWISFNNDDMAESLAYYNDGMNHLEGWLWSDNIGWISLNCSTDSECDYTDPNEQYKVSVDGSGNFSGRAWSSSVGWLSFDRSETGNPPGEPYQTEGAIARYDNNDDKIRGWGRFLAGKGEGTGGWDGWVKLRCHDAECYHGWDDGKTATSGFFLRNDDYLDGWAWGGTVVGWISPWSPNAHHYGLNIDPDDNYHLSGHIWSENIGWISFNREVTGTPPSNDVCPDGSCLGLLDLNDLTLKGWARAVNHGGGWDGWISLSGTAQDETVYGPELNPENRHFEGWIYGGEVIGWISLNCLTDPGCDHTDPNQNHYVYTTLEIGLEAIELEANWDYICQATRHPVLEWSVEGGEQGGYLLEIYKDSGLNELVYQYEAEAEASSHWPDSEPEGCDLGENGYQNDPVCDLEFSTQYWWRVKVRGSGPGATFGPWSETATFTVESTHDYPVPRFSYSPDPVPHQTNINFNSEASTASGGQSVSVWSWVIENGDYRYEDETTSADQNPVVVFEEKETYSVTLGVTDSAGYGPCYLNKSVPVTDQVDVRWLEISPIE